LKPNILESYVGSTNKTKKKSEKSKLKKTKMKSEAPRLIFSDFIFVVFSSFFRFCSSCHHNFSKYFASSIVYMSVVMKSPMRTTTAVVLI